MCAADFEQLLLGAGRFALGAAVGSVITQTMLRDSYKQQALARVFALMGAALALSPVLGLFSGGLLAERYGHQGVFCALLMLALLLWGLCWRKLGETRPAQTDNSPLLPLAGQMLRDASLWRNAGLVALFNTMLFSYYSLAPFLFAQLGWNARQFGWSGATLALATLLGSLLNRRLLQQGWQPQRLIRMACRLALLSGCAVWAIGGSAWLLLPMMGVVVAFGIAIPNVLSQALQNYRAAAGSAGALFGLGYYLLLSLGLALAGLAQQLGMVLALAAALAMLCQWRQSRPAAQPAGRMR
ncbi:MFS transporter [Chromobacterium sphagni]|uniref:MFS transporter n=1 Tax=Chromobacterium sphagni TaxID=1903179 RepID=UPI000A746E7D|nr:MFS transporter [Chromobacterium sphagni]